MNDLVAFNTFSVVQPKPLSTSKTFSTHQEETWYGWDTFKGYCHKAVKVRWGRNQSLQALLNTSKWAIAIFLLLFTLKMD